MGGWDEHHAELTEPLRYGEWSYLIAAELLADCATVEDWGCGGGGFKAHCRGTYVGVDSSASAYATMNAELAEYTSSVEGILVRHVLEHTYDWFAVLRNALASFTERLVVVIFTPWSEDDASHVLFTEPDYGDAPVISFARADILEPFATAGLKVYEIGLEADDTAFGGETILWAQR